MVTRATKGMNLLSAWNMIGKPTKWVMEDKKCCLLGKTFLSDLKAFVDNHARTSPNVRINADENVSLKFDSEKPLLQCRSNIRTLPYAEQCPIQNLLPVPSV